MKSTNGIVLLACLLAAAVAVADGGGPSHDSASIVRLPAEALAQLGVTVATAGPGRIDAGIELLGQVRPNGDTLAHIVPRFPGIVRDVRRSVGDDVRAGEVLATIESNESLAPYEMKTQLDGTVIERHVTRGETVDREKQAFVIADLSSVWIDLDVYQKDLRRVRVGQSVLVSIDPDELDAEGRISYIAPVVDVPTRTATARVVLANPSRAWRPGLFVTARILDAVDAAVAVRRSAVQIIDGRPTVFVQAADGFAARALMLGRAGETWVEVLSGLTAGERYVATNSFLFKAELGKGAAAHED
jgi:cobalt-zinc-cadmium efflux system membrane fusion protein